MSIPFVSFNADAPMIRTLFSVPCRLGGVGSACVGIASGFAALGYECEVHTPRMDIVPARGVKVRAMLPRPFKALNYERLRAIVDPRLANRYLESLEPGDIAHIWPAADPQVYRSARAAGFTVVAEAVNTMMSSARQILDEEYESLGLKPTHGITDRRIALQEERYANATAIFAPSPAVEASLRGRSGAGLVLPASYGTWVPRTRPPRPERRPNAPVTVLFTGTACVRKGIHKVLGLWPSLPRNIHLRIAGAVEPAIAEMFADVLSLPNVSAIGFTRDMATEYQNADLALLPSLEEGDPLVTYEACAAGLPMVATPIGAGRIGDETGCISILETGSPEELRNRIITLASDADQRRALADRAWTAVQDYDWIKVAERRYRQLVTLRILVAA
jgi:glycosyltransferase involved in cell wall biosynthesis